MLEQLPIQKSLPQVPSSPTSTNRIQKYFENSSFLLQQQQISLFIKDFPLIVLKDIKNINVLIDVLIKQNQLLGNKCQQQVNLMKDSFAKYEKILKVNKQLKIEKEKIQKQKKQSQENFMIFKIQSEKNDSKKEQIQTLNRKFDAERLKFQLSLKQSNELNQAYQQLIKNMSTGNYRKCEEYLKQTAILNGTPNRQQFQIFLQKQRKKSKYYGKVKQCVEEFCGRLERVIKVVSQSVLQTEIKTETSQFMELIDELIENGSGRNRKHKRKTQQSQKNILSTSQLGATIHHTYGKDSNSFFEGMILKLTENAIQNNTTKEQICSQLQNLRKKLKETKEQYEKMLKKLHKELQSKQKNHEQKNLMKEETIKHYEAEIQKIRIKFQQNISQQQRLEEQLISCRRELQVTQLKLGENEARYTQLELQSNQKYDTLRKQNGLKIIQMERISNMKSEQREQLIKQLSQRRKREQIQYQEIVSELKKKNKRYEEEIDELNHQLKNLNREVQDFQNKFSRAQTNSKETQTEISKYKNQLNSMQEKDVKKNRHIQELKQTLKSIQHQKNLQNSYISELETKVNTLNNKIKNLETKNKNQNTVKKQITAIKNSLAEEKQKSQQYEGYCLQMKDQNHRLKIVVKEMKKELEEVYVRLAALKEIEIEREKFIEQAQKSERMRSDLYKEYEDMRFDMLKMEADNKKLALELRHFKNIVNRIDFVEESYQ